MAHPDPFSMSTMLNSLPHLRLPPRGISAAVPPPGFTPQRETEITREKELETMFNLMTNSSEGSVAQFKDIISNLERRELQRMASFLTSDSNYFMEIARNKYGSKRLQKLLGKSDDVDTYFSAAIMRQFLQIMTHKYASYVAIRAMVVFEEEKKKAMYEHTLHYALYIARDQHGCIALNEIITDADDPYYRNRLLDFVARNALCLSYDVSGNFVIQHVLKLNDSRCTHNIAVNLRGHCVNLSFRKHGSYIMERLLGAEESMVVVVEELLECEGSRLLRLARSEYGNFVVAKALRVTREEMIRVYLFCGLANKLTPFLPLLRRGNIAAILDSIP